MTSCRTKNNPSVPFLVVLLLAAGVAWGEGARREPADTVYEGGTVITMDPAQPQAEAVAVRDGRIVALGSREEIRQAWAGEDTRVVPLGGNTLLPGFIDGHSHISQALTLADWANVSVPPVGAVDSIAILVATLRRHAAQQAVAPGQWILAYGYDPEGLAEKRHVTRDDLDPAFPDNPVLLMHVSGHGAVLNSAGLALAGIDGETPTPAGGVIARRTGSREPAGLLMETAMIGAMAALPRPTHEQQLQALDTVQRLYAQNGYTTIQDGATDPALLATLRSAADAGALWLDVVALPVVLQAGELDAGAAAAVRTLPGTPEARGHQGADRRLAAGKDRVFHRADARARPRR